MRKSGDESGALSVCGGLLLGAGIGTFVVVAATESLLRDSTVHPDVYPLVYGLEAFIILYGMMLVAFKSGANNGRKMLERGVELRDAARKAEAESKEATAKATETDRKARAAVQAAHIRAEQSTLAAERKASEAQRTADERIQAAKDQLSRGEKALRSALELARSKMESTNLKQVQLMETMPLVEKLHASVLVGRYDHESEIDYQSRRHDIMERRARRWETDTRYGHRLLQLVEHQRGMCGDPYKDKSRKGCGCWLYALHPSTVHLDHIQPKSKGGSDDIKNMQALCLFCNTRAGARTQEDEDIIQRARETLKRRSA